MHVHSACSINMSIALNGALVHIRSTMRTLSLSMHLFLSSCVLDFVRHGSHMTQSSLCLCQENIPVTATLSHPCFHPTRMHFIPIAQLGCDIYIHLQIRLKVTAYSTSFVHYATAQKVFRGINHTYKCVNITALEN